MRGFYVSKQLSEFDSLHGSVNQIKIEISKLGYPDCSFIKRGILLRDTDNIELSDTVILLPFGASKSRVTYSTTSESQLTEPLLNEPNVEDETERNNEDPTNNLWKVASFGFRLLLLLLIFFRRNPSEITFFYILGMSAYLGYNYVPFSLLSGAAGSFDVNSSIITTFIGTLIPGIMDVDPSKLLMEMHAAQQEQDNDEQLRMQ
eukprot:NODE_170_length_14437_cov_1.447273.p8 type:complete len:204 gc:universal NODE_170_length_14437_cov_1.447273:11928-11317(-)